jgi:hypothetical protein
MEIFKNLPSKVFYFHKHIEALLFEILFGISLYIFPGILGNDLFVSPVTNIDEINIWKRIFGIFIFAFGVLHWAIMHLVARTDRDEKMNRYYRDSFAFIQKTILSCEVFMLFALSHFLLNPWCEKNVNRIGILSLYGPIISGIVIRTYTLKNLDRIYGH